jgi:NAD dependent epimerase/dehydratase family enzyme
MNPNRPMQVLITGASGFVGDHLVRRLKTVLPADGELLLADRHAGGNANLPNCKSIHLDITAEAAIDYLQPPNCQVDTWMSNLVISSLHRNRWCWCGRNVVWLQRMPKRADSGRGRIVPNYPKV